MCGKCKKLQHNNWEWLTKNKFIWMCTKYASIPNCQCNHQKPKKIQHALQSTCQTISTCNIIHISVPDLLLTWLYPSCLKAGVWKVWRGINCVNKHNHSHLTINHLLVSQHTNWIIAHYCHIMQGKSRVRWMQQFRISLEVLTYWISDFHSTGKSKVVSGHTIRAYRRSQQTS